MSTLVGCGQGPPPSASKSDSKMELAGYEGTGVGANAAKSELSWRERQLDNSDFKKGEEFLKAKDYTTAIICFTKAIEGDPKHYAAYFQRGFCYSREAKYSDDWKKAISDYTVAVANTSECPFKKDDIYVSRGCAYYNLGGDDNYEKGVADCTEAIRLNARNAEAYYFRSLSKRRIAGLLGDKESADRDLAEAQRLKPGIDK